MISISYTVKLPWRTTLVRKAFWRTGKPGIIGKWLVMLKEVAPQFGRASLVGNPATTAYDYFLSVANRRELTTRIRTDVSLR
jgi:hypothetical protein